MELPERISDSKPGQDHRIPSGFTRGSARGYITLFLVFSLSGMLFVVLPTLTAYRFSLLLIFAIISMLDRIGGLYCVMLVPSAGVALSLIDPKADFPFDILAFGLWIASMFLHGKGSFRNLRLTLLDKLVFLYSLFGLIYVLVSPSLKLGYQGYKYDYRAFLTYALLRISGSNWNDFWKLSKFLLITMLFFFSDGVYRYFFDYESTLKFFLDRASDPLAVTSYKGYFGMTVGSVPRMTSIFMFATGFGPTLAVGILFIIGFRTRMLKKIGIVGWSAVLAAFTVGVILSYSRSAWIGLFIGLITMALLSPKGVSKPVTAVLSILFALVGVFALLPQQISQFVVRRFFQLGTGDVGPGGHFYFLLLSVSDLIQHPLGKGLGVGFAKEVRKISGTVWNESTYLKVGQEMGVPMMVLFIVVLIAMVFCMKNVHDFASDPMIRSFLRIAIAASVVNIAINVTLPIWEQPITYLMVFSAAFACNILPATVNRSFQNR